MTHVLTDVEPKVGDVYAELLTLPLGQPLELHCRNVRSSWKSQLYGKAAKQGSRLSLRRNRATGVWEVRLLQEPQEYQPRVYATTQRNEEIFVAVESGETFEEVAQRFGVTRQRIEQIYRARKQSNFSIGIAPELRAEKLNKFISAYLDATPELPICLLCSEPYMQLPGDRGFCPSCLPRYRAIQSVGSCLRSYRKFNDRHYLAKALVKVRKYDLRPEEMEFA